MPSRSSQLGVLAADLHLFQLGQLAQAGVEDGVGLDLRQAEAGDQDGLGLVLLADDADDLVEVEEDDQQAVQDVQPLLDGLASRPGAAGQHLAAVVQEGHADLLQAHDARRAGGVQHVHVDREADFPDPRA
jgi:hypothetical protein